MRPWKYYKLREQYAREGKTADMAKPKLSSMTIRPGKNGGFNVRHEFESKPNFSKSMGMSMAGAAPEEHNFGPGEDAGLMKHIGQALALKGLSKAGGGGLSGEDL